MQDYCVKLSDDTEMNLEIGNRRDPRIQPQFKKVYPADIPAWARGMDCKYFIWKIKNSTYMCTQNEYIANKSILTKFEHESPEYANLVASTPRKNPRSPGSGITGPGPGPARAGPPGHPGCHGRYKLIFSTLMNLNPLRHRIILIFSVAGRL